MRLTRSWLVVLLSLIPSITVVGAHGQSASPCTTQRAETVCPDGAKAPDQPCSSLPHDVNFKLKTLVGYGTLSPECQQPFDQFSWQSFVALNWPLDNLSQPRPWEDYLDPDVIFNGAVLKNIRATTQRMAHLTAAQGAKVKILYRTAKLHVLPGEHFSQFLQATEEPLIDRNLNFALYEERVNSVWVSYVTKAACKNMQTSTCLNTNAGQTAFIKAGNAVQFPVGFYKDDAKALGGSVGAIEIKAAWRILDTTKGDQPDRFYTRVADIYIDAQHTVNNKPLVVRDVIVGLVGFHINTYTTDGKGSVWSTFEQEDNAPPQGNAEPRSYSFYNNACTSCPLNTPPAKIGSEQDYLWGTTAPYAERYATDGKYGTQVTIVNPFYPETEEVNARWHKLMPNTVWTHYRLIGSQWVNGEVPQQGIPQYLANSTQETYVPQQSSSCINCHSAATLNPAPNPPADLSFLLSHAQGEANGARKPQKGSGRKTAQQPAISQSPKAKP